MASVIGLFGQPRQFTGEFIDFPAPDAEHHLPPAT
jgi:hypothetical protein